VKANPRQGAGRKIVGVSTKLQRDKKKDKVGEEEAEEEEETGDEEEEEEKEVQYVPPIPPSRPAASARRARPTLLATAAPAPPDSTNLLLIAELRRFNDRLLVMKNDLTTLRHENESLKKQDQSKPDKTSSKHYHEEGSPRRAKKRLNVTASPGRFNDDELMATLLRREKSESSARSNQKFLLAMAFLGTEH
jgi:hypothetical protein